MNDLILFTTEDSRSQITLRAQKDTVWPTQLVMAKLFEATKQNLSLHLKNVFEDGELDVDSVVKDSLTTAADSMGEIYVKFDQGRKRKDAIQADQQDETDLKALEIKIKQRPKK